MSKNDKALVYLSLTPNLFCKIPFSASFEVISGAVLATVVTYGRNIVFYHVVLSLRAFR